MKILYCIPALYNPGGMERIITEKINYLSQIPDCKLYVVTTDQQLLPNFFQLNKLVKVINLDINFDSDFAQKPGKKYLALKKKLRLYRTELENIIHANKIDICISTGGKELEFLYKMKGDFKKILELHFSKNFRKQFILARHSGYIYKILGNLRNRQLLHQTKLLDAVVVITKADLKEWQKTHSNVSQIYNFITVTSDKPAALENKRAIAVGKLDPQKGFDMLIDAWNLRKEFLEDWTLDIFGQGEWFEMLTEKIKLYHLENNIFLKGISSDIKSEYLNSSLFLFSSRYEGFGLVLAEAMSCGLPAVSFDCPQGPSEIIDSSNGFLIPLGNLEKFADAMVVLAQNKEERIIKGTNATSSIKKFDKDVIMKQWINLFRSLQS